jgi:tetratricopeptide (TPR) repeat protein
MPHLPWTRSLTAAYCLLAACHVGAQPTDVANLERVEVAGKKVEVSMWFRAESERFVVYSDAREEDVNQLLDNLEKLDHLLRIYTQPIRQAEPQGPKLTLYYHSRASGLREVDAAVPADAVGLYSSCESGVQGFGVHIERIPSLADQQLEKGPLNDSLSYVFEAYARHFLYRPTDIRTPASFIDGFAQYFSSVRFSEQQMVVGRVPKAIANYLGFLSEGRKYSLEYDDVLQNNLANARNYAGAAGVRLEFEAKSWLLTHYMLSSDDNRKRLNQYLMLVGDGAVPTAAFERAFGVKTADLGQVLWRYRLRGVEALRVAPQSLPAARVSFRTLPRATGEFVLVDAALKSCPGRQAGESLLKKVAALAARFPDNTLARLTLSRAQIDWGDPQEALSRLNAVLQDDDANFEARYLAGVANLRLAGRSEGNARRAHLQAARQHLQRARGLNPRSPEAAFAAFKAEVAATDAPDDAALQGVISAWQTAREVDALAGSAALAYAYAGKADEAYRTLGSLAQNMHDEPMARWARQWQGRLQAGVTRGDILAEMRRDPLPDMPFKEWTVDKDSVMQKVALNAGLESAESFIKQQQDQQRPGMQPQQDLSGGMRKP